ncbi:glycerol 3-phosphate dehydrogenase-like isoform X2 [Babylonia areolata]
MLHTGFDAPADSLELHCIKRCMQRVFGTLDALGVPYARNGSIMVAWNPDQASKLSEIRASSLKKGVEKVLELPLDDLYRREPNLSRQAQGALWIPEETVLEPCLYGLLLAHHARKHGNKILTHCEVQGWEVNSNSGRSVLQTTRGPVSAKVVINCAGLHGDKVQNMAGIDTFSIKPRKGQYAVFGSTAGHLIHSSILPVPTEKTKGIIVFKTVHNNVIVGPTAEDVESRQRAPIDPGITKRLLEVGRQTIPELNSCSPIGHYTGVRPATQFKEYQIRSYIDRNWITVGGIRSTGVSASLGIAEHVASLVQTDLKAEPTRGPTHSLEASDWNLLPGGTLLVDGHTYGVCHPITLFGMKEGSSNSNSNSRL